MVDRLLDVDLLKDLEEAANSDLLVLDQIEMANLMLNLILDSKLVQETEGPKPKPSESNLQVNAEIPPNQTPPERNTKPSGATLSLPASLRPLGERALAYLNAGFHVLFAGAPGTGKTTLAQFVGHAWDNHLESLKEDIPIGEAPLTTVGNSAWSPFHTIGGLMPSKNGTFTSYAGIFIDPTSTETSKWRLRNSCVVLDEMNRADLDRCIGELYPLLSGSVERVTPAGLPGVQSVEASERFRVVGTINDAHLADIVFPISDGLARRFQRIDLLGGSRDEILTYLELDRPPLDSSARGSAALDAIIAFLEVLREEHLLVKSEDDDRLPFGVAYFAPLQAWIRGKLNLPPTEATVQEQARDLLTGSIRMSAKTKQWRSVLIKFLSKV